MFDIQGSQGRFLNRDTLMMIKEWSRDPSAQEACISAPPPQEYVEYTSKIADTVKQSRPGAARTAASGSPRIITAAPSITPCRPPTAEDRTEDMQEAQAVRVPEEAGLDELVRASQKQSKADYEGIVTKLCDVQQSLQTCGSAGMAGVDIRKQIKRFQSLRSDVMAHRQGDAPFDTWWADNSSFLRQHEIDCSVDDFLYSIDQESKKAEEVAKSLPTEGERARQKRRKPNP